jgi:hypothetical protein
MVLRPGATPSHSFNRSRTMYHIRLEPRSLTTMERVLSPMPSASLSGALIGGTEVPGHLWVRGRQPAQELGRAEELSRRRAGGVFRLLPGDEFHPSFELCRRKGNFAMNAITILGLVALVSTPRGYGQTQAAVEIDLEQAIQLALEHNRALNAARCRHGSDAAQGDT